MKKIFERMYPLTLIIMIPLLNIVYVHLNNPLRPVHNLVTDIDRAIPFVKLFVIPYALWYPFILISLTYFCYKNRLTFYVSLFSIIIGMIISYIFYFLFQTTVPRPVLYGNDFLTNLVKFIYKNDSPYNCFPSIHVLTTYIVMKGISKEGIKNKFVYLTAAVLGVLIIISTQFIKQHVMLDLLLAILMGDIMYKIAEEYMERYLLWIKKPFLWLTMKKKLEI